MRKTLITACETLGMASGVSIPCLVHAFIGIEYVFPAVIGGLLMMVQSYRAAKTAKEEIDELNKKELR